MSDTFHAHPRGAFLGPLNNAVREAVRRAGVEARTGVIDGSAAAPGEVGEMLQAQVPQPGGELASAAVTPLMSLELPAGDWDVRAAAGFNVTGLSPPNLNFVAALSFSTTFPGFNNQGGTACISAQPVNVVDITVPVFQRVLLAAPATLYLLGYCAVLAVPIRCYGYGFMSARRRR